MITLRRALRLNDALQLAFVGAGGKTTALFGLARQFEGSVLVTTSTHLGVEQLQLADKKFMVQTPGDVDNLDPEEMLPLNVVFGLETEGKRVTGPPAETLQALSNFAQRHSLSLLVEADGARRLALKAPADHEPAIPDFVDCVVVVAGLSAINKPLSEEFVHRPERFAALSQLKLGEPITADAVSRVLLHAEGGLKNIPTGARRVVLLNQADTPELEGAARGLANTLLTGFDAVLVASLESSPEIKAVYETVAGIVLAAGESKRLGNSKQLLDWKGKPFVRQVVETALASGLYPVIVVTGADAEPVEATLTGLPIQLVRNTDWAAGQSTSVRAGLAALPPKVGAALFLVVDQPQLPIALIETLRAEHSTSLAPIVAPLVDGQRSNPVLFDRVTFPDFALLQGDVGGRAIFSRHPVTWLPWLDASISIDVDSPEDYDRLLRQAG